MLKFSERKKLADEYRKWLEVESKKLEELCGTKVADTPEAVIAFLSQKEYLKEEYNG